MVESRTSHRAWIVWGAGVLAYTLAILHRSSLGVMGLAAASHFHATAGIVATFMVLQLAVYALAQLPAGMLLDRMGPRFVITLGAVFMTAGQTTIALTDQIPVAILARILVGIGDACTFSSAIRLIPSWFPVRMVPMLTQLTGLLGQVGQIGSTVGLVALVGSRGWRTTYLVAAGIGALGVAISAGLLRDAPAGIAGQRTSVALRQMPHEVLEVIRHPATGVGFWAHWSTNLGGVVYSMMWGMPYLTRAEGRSTGIAIMGGFTASLILIQIIGWMLDVLCPGGAYTLSGFRWAMSVQLVFFAIGIAGIVFCRNRLRRLRAAAG